MASYYQTFRINIDDFKDGTPRFQIRSIFRNGSGSRISVIAEVSINGGPFVLLQDIGSNEYKVNINVPNGSTNNIIIKENNNVIYDLGNYSFPAQNAGCRSNVNASGFPIEQTLLQYEVKFTNAPTSNFVTMHTRGASDAGFVVEHSIDGGATFKTASYTSLGAQGIFNSSFGQAEAIAVDPKTLTCVFKSTGAPMTPTCSSLPQSVNWVNKITATPLTATASHTNPTTNGGTDGSIIIIVADGSGNFSFLWNDLATTNNRANLSAGTYSVTITDDDTLETFDINNIVLTEPAEEIITFPNTTVTASPISPIRFKENKTGGDLPLENYTFCEQPTENMAKPFTPEIFNVLDQTRLQFLSDYGANNIKKTNVDTGAFENLPLELVQDNISGGSNYSASLEGLFFEGNPALKIKNSQGNAFPNPLVGDIIIITNEPAYNGSYAIIGITKNNNEDSVWINGISSGNAPVTITFLGSIRFNVYELPINFQSWGVGTFKLEFEVTIDINTTVKLTSEFISVKPYTPNTLLLTYSNIDNAFGVIWSTGILMNKRHEGFFIKAVPTRDSTNYRNSNDSPSILNSYVRNKEEYNIFELTWFSIQRLALIYSCDSFILNGKKMFVEELPETEQSNSRYLLGRHTVVAEEVNWLDNQNTTDTGDSFEDSVVVGGDTEEVIGV